MNDYQTPERMALKRKAIPLPDLAGKSVLDVGCDHGYWCWLAADLDAQSVVGLDRNRDGLSLIDWNIKKAIETGRAGTFTFEQVNVGKQWREFGKHDVVFCFSMYHHIFENCGDHRAIWFWLWRHTGEELLWENPTGADDPVVRINVSKPGYDLDAILDAAELYFDVEPIGPALHVKTREVWRCIPKKMPLIPHRGRMTSGGGGASKAFTHADNRRINEIESILGVRMLPGTLNLNLDLPFTWHRDYYRAQLLETVDRSNLNADWKPRWARFYPITVNGIEAHAIRFEGETYRDNYLEVISVKRLRDAIEGEVVDVRS